MDSAPAPILPNSWDHLGCESWDHSACLSGWNHTCSFDLRVGIALTSVVEMGLSEVGIIEVREVLRALRLVKTYGLAGSMQGATRTLYRFATER